MIVGRNVPKKAIRPPLVSIPTHCVAAKKYVDKEKLAPSNNGPNVSSAQKTSRRGTSARGRTTRKIAFMSASIVPSSNTAVAASATMPTALSVVVFWMN